MEKHPSGLCYPNDLYIPSPYVSVINSSCSDSLTIKIIRLPTDPERECMFLPEKGNRIVFVSGFGIIQDLVRSLGGNTGRDE